MSSGPFLVSQVFSCMHSALSIGSFLRSLQGMVLNEPGRGVSRVPKRACIAILAQSTLTFDLTTRCDRAHQNDPLPIQNPTSLRSQLCPWSPSWIFLAIVFVLRNWHRVHFCLCALFGWLKCTMPFTSPWRRRSGWRSACVSVLYSSKVRALSLSVSLYSLFRASVLYTPRVRALLSVSL